jgi:2',3'-cyclic-nucleotide 2'-phosphodiesterase (5'-nucleotidase family)
MSKYGTRKKKVYSFLLLNCTFQLAPFEDQLVTANVSGVMIKAILENSVKHVTGTGHLLQVSGLCYKYDESKPKYGRVISANVQKPDGSCTGGANIDFKSNKEEYGIVTIDFLGVKGSNGFPKLHNYETRDTVLQVLSNCVAQPSFVPAGIQGRVQCVSGKKCPK